MNCLYCRLNRDEPTSYPYWFVSIGGPVVIAVGVIHAAVSHRYSRFIGPIVSHIKINIVVYIQYCNYASQKFSSVLSNRIFYLRFTA